MIMIKNQLLKTVETHTTAKLKQFLNNVKCL